MARLVNWFDGRRMVSVTNPDGRWLPWKTRYLGYDVQVCIVLVIAAFLLYLATLLPGVGWGDVAELQRVVPQLHVAHPTGYPLYTLLGWLWSQIPLGTIAWRMNAFSAIVAALTISVLYLTARTLGQWRLVAAAIALLFATSLDFWTQATITEVYAMATLLQALVILALVQWQAGRWPFWVIGLVFGLGFAHHRTIVLMVPGTLLFLALSRWPRIKEIGKALAIFCVCCLLYLYIPISAPPDRDPWGMLWDYAFGKSEASKWIDLHRLRLEGLSRPRALLHEFVWPQMLIAGAVLAVAGAVRLVQRRRSYAALLLTSSVIIFLFCCAYYVPDLHVFFIPMHLITALLIGEGAMLLLQRLPHRVTSGAAMLLLILPMLLLARNLPTIVDANLPRAEMTARERMAQLPPEPVLVLDNNWVDIDVMRYLQEIEGQRPDVEFGLVTDHQRILDALAEGRAVYLLEPQEQSWLAQQPEGRLWRVTGATDLAEVSP